ncbi:MAG TPA: hypothetical protein VFW40_00200 [Capsulimonadaceae bacterium]|nr:hypothetical protein [Capsulimonadaceae bacterium]
MKRLTSVVLAALVLSSTCLSIPACATAHHKKPPAAQQGQDVTVWVNLKTGIYHYPGTRWYGKTKDGTYMKESEAKKDGYRAADNGQ